MRDYSSLTDEELIKEAKNGNFDSFENLVSRHDKRVLSIAAKYVDSAEDLKDIYQDVFIRVYRGIKKFQMRSEFSTWLYRITTNVCLTYCRQQQRYRKMSVMIDHTNEAANKDHSTNGVRHAIHPADVTSSEMLARIANALNLLSPQQKVVFTLRHYEGYKLNEIAKFMKCTEGTVKKQLFTAVRRLRGELKDLYLEGVSG